LKIIKFYPQDVLFFRDAKPFDAGWDNSALSHYPMPSVFYGALRTALIGSDFEGFKNGKYRDFIGTPTEHGKFRTIGPFTFNKTDLFFPMPKHISIVKKDNNLTVIKLKPFQKLEPYKIVSAGKEATLIKLWHRSYETLEAPDIEYLNLNSLLELLNGEDSITIDNRSETYKIENRIGIKLDTQKSTAKERYIYRESKIRFFEGCGFASFVENDMEKLDNVKSVFLGGERHIAFTKIDQVKNLLPKSLNGRIMIYLATPAVFKNGVLPESFDGENITINNVKCKLISIANSKPLTVSTFDIVKNKPRASKLAVPAGSVYFVESEKEIKSDGFITFTDEMEEYGFGRALIGGWDYE